MNVRSDKVSVKRKKGSSGGGNRQVSERLKRVVSRCAPLAITLAVVAIVYRSPALALDPKKAITQYSHDMWQTKEGLPQNSVYAIVQTPDGYLWLGTEEGLVRFDGVHFTVFDTKNTKAINHSFVTALFEDKQGACGLAPTEG